MDGFSTDGNDPNNFQNLLGILSQYGSGNNVSNQDAAVNPLSVGSSGGIGSFGSGLGSTGNSGFGLNLGTLGFGLNALGTLGGLYSGISALNLANKQYNLQSQMANANLNNSIKSYNTALNDRISSRAVAENKGQDYVNNYMQQNQLSR